MEKKTRIFISVVTVLTLIVTLIGATFAYFASTYTQSGNAQTINVTTRTMATITYTTGASINGSNLTLASGAGDKTLASGEFNIAVTRDSVKTDDVTFKIGINFTKNEFIQTEKATTANRNDVECRLYSGTTSGNLTLVGTVDCTGKSGNVDIKNNASINIGTNSTTYYRIDIVLYNAGTVDNTNVDKELSGTIYIDGLSTALTNLR